MHVVLLFLPRKILQKTQHGKTQRMQPYLFQPSDSEASLDTDFTNELNEEEFERLQSTDW